jgi:hypothetical protein
VESHILLTEKYQCWNFCYIGVPTPGDIYLGTSSSHTRIIFCLYSANYIFVEFSSQLGTEFHRISGLQVIFTSSVAPITPGGI